MGGPEISLFYRCGKPHKVFSASAIHQPYLFDPSVFFLYAYFLGFVNKVLKIFRHDGENLVLWIVT